MSGQGAAGLKHEKTSRSPGRCLQHNTCVSMLSPPTPYLSLPNLGLNSHGELWKEGEAQCGKQNPKMAQAKDTAKLIHDVSICA